MQHESYGLHPGVPGRRSSEVQELKAFVRIKKLNLYCLFIKDLKVKIIINRGLSSRMLINMNKI